MYAYLVGDKKLLDNFVNNSRLFKELIDFQLF